MRSYPRTVREWNRGTPLREAMEVFSGDKSDVSIGAGVSSHREADFEWRYRSPSFFTIEEFVRRRNADGTAATPWYRVMMPDDCRCMHFGDQLVLQVVRGHGQ